MVPSDWNKSKELEYAGQVLRFEDNFDATSNLVVLVSSTDKKFIIDFGSPKPFPSPVDYLLGKHAYFGLSVSEGCFDSGVVTSSTFLKAAFKFRLRCCCKCNHLCIKITFQHFGASRAMCAVQLVI
ncbi:Oxygen-evolving enhancer protein 2 chloroplastic [Bienertia sinuspersici]